MFSRSKRLDELHALMSGMQSSFDHSLNEIRAAHASSLLNFQREAEASKLALDRTRDAKDHAEQKLAETQRELDGVKSKLAQLSDNFRRLGLGSWTRGDAEQCK
jgi:phage-related minor tail protein